MDQKKTALPDFTEKMKPHIEHTCNAATLPELEHAITKSFNPSPVSFHIQHVLDFKTWLSSELEDISGHSIPHCFKFTMGPHQQPNIHYKEYSTEWKNSWYSLSTPPPDSDPISITCHPISNQTPGSHP
ncbi:hypothetical protein Bbelb_050110 [Branchiostoma belcheri]|nr:hypothetical protein Bbelb_050110 [Branchiostoma belcheri]